MEKRTVAVGWNKLARGLAEPDSAEDRLIKAAKGGFPDEIQEALRDGAHVEFYCRAWRQTALMWACETGHADCLELLVEAGARHSWLSMAGRSAGSLAAEAGSDDCLRALSACGADLASQDRSGWTPLAYAAKSGHEMAARLLIALGSPIDTRDSDGFTPLLRAAESMDEGCVKALAQAGADLGAKNSVGTGACELVRARGQGGEALASWLEHAALAQIERRQLFSASAPKASKPVAASIKPKRL